MQRNLIVLIASLFLVAFAPAAVTVYISGSGTTSNNSPNSGEAFTLTSSGTVYFNIYADSSTDIGRITLTGSGTVSLLIGNNSGSFPGSQSSSLSTALSRDWNGLALSSFSGTVRVAAAVGRDLKDNVTATQVYRLQVDDDLEDVVTATGVDNGGDMTTAIGPVKIGHSLLSDGGLEANATPGGGQTVTITSVEVGEITSTGSVLAGPISASNGSIGLIEAAGDIDIVSGGIQAKNGITSIIAKSIDADIAANANGGSGDLQRLETTEGDFAGSLAANYVKDTVNDEPITIAGDLLASMEFDGDFYGVMEVEGSFELDPPVEVTIHGSFFGRIIADAIGVINVDGDMYGFGGDVSWAGVLAVGGGIDALNVIGDAPPVWIGTDGVRVAADWIGTISAARWGGEISATGAEFTYADVGQLIVSGDYADCAGYFNSIGLIDIGGDVTGNMNFTEVGPDALIRIGGSLDYPVSVHTALSMEGQFIINAGNETGEWLAAFSVAQPGAGWIQLTPLPHYPQTSASIGGGAVGLVPFNRHALDSSPAQDEYVYSVPTRMWDEVPYERETIEIEHYGPIFDSDVDEIPPVRLYRKYLVCEEPCNDPPGYEEVDAEDFIVLVNPDGAARKLWVCLTPDGSSAVPFTEFYQYKVVPRIDGEVTDLRSDGTGLGTAPNVYQYVHEFFVWPSARPNP